MNEETLREEFLHFCATIAGAGSMRAPIMLKAIGDFWMAKVAEATATEHHRLANKLTAFALRHPEYRGEMESIGVRTASTSEHSLRCLCQTGRLVQDI